MKKWILSRYFELCGKVLYILLRLEIFSWKRARNRLTRNGLWLHAVELISQLSSMRSSWTRLTELRVHAIAAKALLIIVKIYLRMFMFGKPRIFFIFILSERRLRFEFVAAEKKLLKNVLFPGLKKMARQTFLYVSRNQPERSYKYWIKFKIKNVTINQPERCYQY